MIDNRMNKALTVFLIIIIVAIFVALGFAAYDFFQKYAINAGANEAIDEFDKKIAELNTVDENNSNNNAIENQNVENNQGNNSTGSTTTNYSRKTTNMQYKGYDVVGKIEIPKIKLNYPILSMATDSSMKVSVGVVYGPGINEVGNTVIMGHNFRNGTLFSNNSKLSIGDIIYITDMSGRKIKYTIYNKYTTSSTDFDYAIRETAGTREISLASCTDDSRSRLIIWAREG